MVIKTFKDNITLSDEIISEIGKFTVLWALFELNFCKNNCVEGTLEIIYDKISISSENLKCLSKVIKDRAYIQRLLLKEYVDEGLHPENSRNSSEKRKIEMKDFIEDPSQNHILGCLLIIRRIRNNLMHGLKNIMMLDDQMKLFVAANQILEEIRWKNE